MQSTSATHAFRMFGGCNGIDLLAVVAIHVIVRAMSVARRDALRDTCRNKMLPQPEAINR
ncbi:Uncharacterised protein [Vibrio cholerae]|uniref:Uncharacterized protein n=1 Tax=Vibrio cholerae TaxID=666 RepID=A0A655X9I5_VIBCL|nr:Uncharacterised protein [Vibrio cholerae]